MKSHKSKKPGSLPLEKSSTCFVYSLRHFSISESIAPRHRLQLLHCFFVHFLWTWFRSPLSISFNIQLLNSITCLVDEIIREIVVSTSRWTIICLPPTGNCTMTTFCIICAAGVICIFPLSRWSEKGGIFWYCNIPQRVSGILGTFLVDISRSLFVIIAERLHVYVAETIHGFIDIYFIFIFLGGDSLNF